MLVPCFEASLVSVGSIGNLRWIVEHEREVSRCLISDWLFAWVSIFKIGHTTSSYTPRRDLLLFKLVACDHEALI